MLRVCKSLFIFFIFTSDGVHLQSEFLDRNFDKGKQKPSLFYQLLTEFQTIMQCL